MFHAKRDAPKGIPMKRIHRASGQPVDTIGVMVSVVIVVSVPEGDVGIVLVVHRIIISGVIVTAEIHIIVIAVIPIQRIPVHCAGHHGRIPPILGCTYRKKRQRRFGTVPQYARRMAPSIGRKADLCVFSSETK
ncbi:MAG: hypothetical protein AB7P76_09915 [Candidatus Melainabacteria bacterium]